MKALSGLLFLSALAAIEAAGLNVMQKLTGDFGNISIVGRSSEEYGGLGFAGAMQIGEQLKEKALSVGATLKDIVKMLDDEMGRIIENKEERIPWITQVFVCFYEIDGIYTYDDLHEIALEENAENFLRASIAFNHCETFEEFLPFLISSYKSDWYHEEFWTGHQVDWGKVELGVILEANNPKFLEDFLSNKLPFTTHHRLSSDQILDLIIEHDFLDAFNYYKTLELVTFERLHKRIRKLVEFGSVKLLRVLHGSTGKNLNLQNYSTRLEKLPERPEDWEFLKEQGYKYMPVHKILEAACRGGHIYILREFYEINERLIPTSLDLEEAARRGHWDVIKWGIDKGIWTKKGGILFLAILNRHLEFIQLFENEYNFTIDSNPIVTWTLYGYDFIQGTNIVQVLANEAAERGRSRVVEWISDKFNVLPERYYLRGATVRILKLLKLKKPETFDADLLNSINQMSSIKWMWSNYDHLFTDEIKKYWTNGYHSGKELRWIHKNWKMLPKSINSNISIADLEFFIKETNGEVDISRVAEYAVEKRDFGKIQYLITKHPSCLNMKLIGTAMKRGHVEIVDILDKHFGYQFANFLRACTCGHLGILKRSFVGGGDFPANIRKGVAYATEADQLGIIDYMMNKGYFGANQVGYYVEVAIECDSIYFFNLLSKEFGDDKLPKDYPINCWRRGKFKILKFIMPRLSKSEIEMLLKQNFDRSNYHLRKIVEDEYEKRTQGV